MRIAVDATPLLNARTGVGNFTAALLAGLAQEPDLEVTAFPVSLRGRSALADLVPPGIATVTPPLPARILRQLWSRGDSPRIDRFIGQHDLVHGPNFVTPPTRAVALSTVHDLTALRFPEMCHPDALQYPDLVTRLAARGGWVHTVSHAIRDEVIATLGLDPARVVAIPNGFTSMAGGDAAAGRRRAGVDDYLLVVGTVEPRKDLPGLLRVIDMLAQHGTPIPMVHVGSDGWGAEAFAAAHTAMAHPHLVRRLGRQDDNVLRDLYAGARVMAYPSVYEGFGLPILEAMSAGVPVVTTRVPAIVEVAGDAAVLVDVGDPDAMAAAIGEVWSSDERCAAQAERGRARALEYSWDAMASGIAGLYRTAVSSVPFSRP